MLVRNLLVHPVIQSITLLYLAFILRFFFFDTPNPIVLLSLIKRPLGRVLFQNQAHPRKSKDYPVCTLCTIKPILVHFLRWKMKLFAQTKRKRENKSLLYMEWLSKNFRFLKGMSLSLQIELPEKTYKTIETFLTRFTCIAIYFPE